MFSCASACIISPRQYYEYEISEIFSCKIQPPALELSLRVASAQAEWPGLCALLWCACDDPVWQRLLSSRFTAVRVKSYSLLKGGHRLLSQGWTATPSEVLTQFRIWDPLFMMSCHEARCVIACDGQWEPSIGSLGGKSSETACPYGMFCLCKGIRNLPQVFETARWRRTKGKKGKENNNEHR